MDRLEGEEIRPVAQTVRSRRRRHPGTTVTLTVSDARNKRELDWQSIPELRVLRSAVSLREEFLLRKAAAAPRGLGELLYAVMKFPEHPDAPEMLNCCAYNRWRSGRSTLHLVQALQGFDLALRVVRSGAQKWKIAINRCSLLNFMGAPGVALRTAGWLVAEIPADHSLYRFLCFSLGRSYFMLGRYDLAAEVLGRAARAFGDDPDVPVATKDQVVAGWARCVARAGRLEQAQAIMRTVIDNQSPYCLATEAELLYVAGQWRKFIELAQTAIRSFPPQNPWSLERLAVAELHFQMGRAYEQLDQHDMGCKHLAVSRLLGSSLGSTDQCWSLVPKEL